MMYGILAPLTILPTISYREPMQIDREREHQEPDHSDKSGPFPIPATIPVFPLPNVVLFPKTYLPLHIFEPRYRQ
ncbi:MAG TPA: LON peptidase substrate-binding domain-containing protein, partial [Nitrospira sp.]|nr:LON peptidase substrate-binding domain-containing protein [Nitrospira sp.]